MSVPRPVDIAASLATTNYNAQECIAALYGRPYIPTALGNDVVRACFVAGLRRHPSLASLPEVNALCAHESPFRGAFARARNSGLILGNVIPDEEMMGASQEPHAFHPYCIWYPRLATEQTYRELVRRYPAMEYQVGRACAVWGYADLFRELDLLPDVSIAEEARERDWRFFAGSKEIFELIMEAPLRYKVMDDYTLTINTKASPGAQLNADTAIVTTLEESRKYDEYFDFDWKWQWKPFNITEDWGIDLESTPVGTPPTLTTEETQLIDSPLPFDLPTMNKHLLILLAAYTGNVDRYARLRRPQGVQRELECLMHGIYHSTFMATWLARNEDIIRAVGREERFIKMLWRSIHARRVMNNSIEQLLERREREDDLVNGHTDEWAVPDDELPYFIHYPTIPKQDVLWRLASERPAMAAACARVCVAANYRDMFVKIMDMDAGRAPYPDWNIKQEAHEWGIKRGGGPSFYEDFIEKRRSEMEHPPCPDNPDQFLYKAVVPWTAGDPSDDELWPELRDCPEMLHLGHDPDVFDAPYYSIYENRGLETGKIELWVSVPEGLKQAVRESEFPVGYVAYRNQPIYGAEPNEDRNGYLPGQE